MLFDLCMLWLWLRHVPPCLKQQQRTVFPGAPGQQGWFGTGTVKAAHCSSYAHLGQVLLNASVPAWTADRECMHSEGSQRDLPQVLLPSHSQIRELQERGRTDVIKSPASHAVKHFGSHGVAEGARKLFKRALSELQLAEV